MAGESILVVDDNPGNVKLIRFLLTRRGYDVHTAMHASEALRLLETFVPDLILMDIQMPDIDGLELTRRLKSDPRTSGVPVIALTAFAMKGDEERAREAGCDGYVTKPIDTHALPGIVAAKLVRPRGNGTE
jgi:CheY-like chemotaxis protein